MKIVCVVVVVFMPCRSSLSEVQGNTLHLCKFSVLWQLRNYSKYHCYPNYFKITKKKMLTKRCTCDFIQKITLRLKAYTAKSICTDKHNIDRFSRCFIYFFLRVAISLKWAASLEFGFVYLYYTDVYLLNKHVPSVTCHSEYRTTHIIHCRQREIHT